MSRQPSMNLRYQGEHDGHPWQAVTLRRDGTPLGVIEEISPSRFLAYTVEDVCLGEYTGRVNAAKALREAAGKDDRP